MWYTKNLHNDELGNHLFTEGHLSIEVDSAKLSNALASVLKEEFAHSIPTEPKGSHPELDNYAEETMEKILLAEVLLLKGNKKEIPMVTQLALYILTQYLIQEFIKPGFPVKL